MRLPKPAVLFPQLQHKSVLLLRSLLLFYFFFLFFRVELYSVINSIYGSNFTASLPGYLLQTAPRDLLAALLLQLPVLLLLMLPLRRTAYNLYTVYTGLLLLFLLGIVCQFEAFEVPFDASLLGSGLNTYMGELFTSAVHEIPSRLLLPFAALAALSLLLIIQQYRHPQQTFSTGNFTLLKKIPALLLILAVVIPATAHQFTLPRRHRISRIPRHVEMRSNPLLELLASDEKPQQPDTSQPVRNSNLKNFQYGHNSDSLTVKRRFPALALPRKKYNIILYFFESTTVQYIGQRVNGRQVTPVWDRLRNNSFIGVNHYTHSPLSHNTLFSVFSSAYEGPDKRWVTLHHPDIKVKGITRHLKQHNYRSAALHSGDFGAFGMGKFLRHQGVDLVMDIADFFRLGHRKATIRSVDDRALIKPAVDFASTNKNQPFFLAIFPTLPHHPYTVPGNKDHKFIIDAMKAEKNRNMQKQLEYYNSLHYADRVLGEFISAMEKQGLLENTLVFIFADHGEAFYQHHGNFLHSLRIYNENTHVPFLIFNKQLFRKPYIYNGVSRHIDIAPTILDATGIGRDPEMEGQSLFSAHNQKLTYLHANWRKNYVGIRDGDWKYILKTPTGQQELYYLKDDPYELTNVARIHTNIARRFREYCIGTERYKRRYFRKRLRQR